ncbi:MAG: LysR substrate-binding domain-containing protein [Cyanobacteriota bacterium]|nr:LysR substrate-binding domain-containing protein [Cyanobacteriota bacterium]
MWLRSGQRAATLNHCNQSTISRRLTRATQVFGVQLVREGAEWQAVGGDLLLGLEREVHQLARFLGELPLRLEIGPTLAPLMASPLPPGWICGALDHLGVNRPLDLLRSRIIDAWITDAGRDLQALGDGCDDLVVLPLLRYPVHLAVAPHHPLAGVGSVTMADLRRFPLPGFSSRCYPWVGPVLEQLGLGSSQRQIPVYDPADWQGLSADGVTLAYFSPFCRSRPAPLVPLDHPPLFTNLGALVCRADLTSQAALHELHALLCCRMQRLLPQLPGVQRL